MKARPAISICLLGFWASALQAQSLLIPRDNMFPPLSLKTQHVKVNIDNQVARVRVEQVFLNPTDRDLEADYYFPLPPDASIKELDLWATQGRRS